MSELPKTRLESRMIYTKLETVGPEKARIFLQSNTENRKLRPSVVHALANAMKRGEWRVTHQGIAFSASGRLLDGQHRLEAIIASGMEVSVLVTYGLPEDAFMAIDRGAGRSTADVLRIPQRDAEVYTMAARVAEEQFSKQRRLTPDQVEAWSLVLGEHLSELNEYCPTSRRFFSQAGMRLAAILHVLDGGDKKYIFNLYWQLVMTETEGLPPVAQSLVKQVYNGTAKRASGEMAQLQGLSRGYVVFDKSKKDNVRILVGDSSTASDWAAKVLSKAMAEKYSERAA